MNAKIWLFRFLTLIGVGFIIVSWLLPWWNCQIEMIDKWVRIHPWGLENNLGTYAGYIDAAQMPSWFGPLMWGYLGLAIAALLLSMFVKNKEVTFWKIKTTLPSILILIVGITYVIVAIVAAIFATIRLEDFAGMKLIGTYFIDWGYPNQTDATGSLMLGYWLTYGAGIYCIILALLRNKITGLK